MDSELKRFLENMQTQMDRMEERMNRLESKVDQNTDKLTSIDDRLARVDDETGLAYECVGHLAGDMTVVRNSTEYIKHKIRRMMKSCIC